MPLFRRTRSPEDDRSDAEWRESLAPDAYRVLRKAGTERPGSSPYEHPTGRPGTYRCAGCEAALFDAADQFDSGTGWPSFSAPVSSETVEKHLDLSMIVPRREATCRRCGGHLGHVFGDGPTPTRERWCINGAALTLDES